MEKGRIRKGRKKKGKKWKGKEKMNNDGEKDQKLENKR